MYFSSTKDAASALEKGAADRDREVVRRALAVGEAILRDAIGKLFGDTVLFLPLVVAAIRLSGPDSLRDLQGKTIFIVDPELEALSLSLIHI